MTFLSSRQNPTIKHALSLQDSSNRKRERLYLIEGERELSRYLQAVEEKKEGPAQAGALLRTFLCRSYGKTDSFEADPRLLGEIFYVTEPVMAKLARRDSPLSILSIAKEYSRSLEELSVGEQACFVIAQGVEKPGNLGALWRVADAVGADAMILSGSSDIWNPSVIRSSVGSFFHLPACLADGPQILLWAQRYKIQLIAATPESPTLYCDLPVAPRCALLLGSEDKGLSLFWRQAIAQKNVASVRLPMRGGADSLNVSCAGAVLLYDLLKRQKDRFR